MDKKTKKGTQISRRVILPLLGSTLLLITTKYEK